MAKILSGNAILYFICIHDFFFDETLSSIIVIFNVSFSKTNVGLCTEHLLVYSNLNLLHNSQWITFPTSANLFLYSFLVSLLHSVITIIVTPWEFFTSALADGLSLETKWQQVSRTLLSILADLNNALVWMVSTRPFIYKSSSPFINPLVTVPEHQL